MNWIVKFNQLEKECIDKILDIIAKYDDYKNDILDNVYTEIYKTKPILNSMVEKLNANTITQEYFDNCSRQIQTVADNMNKEYDIIIPKIYTYLQECIAEILRIRNSTFDTIYDCLQSKKEYILMKKRADLVSRKIANMAHSFDMEKFYEMEIVQETLNDLSMIQEIVQKKNSEYDERQAKLMEQLKEEQKNDYIKIFDYKEMVSLAEKNEYKQIRQTGDHIIMQHKITNKIVPIPAHELKYGLMLQIQKQIKANKIG